MPAKKLKTAMAVGFNTNKTQTETKPNQSRNDGTYKSHFIIRAEDSLNFGLDLFPHFSHSIDISRSICRVAIIILLFLIYLILSYFTQIVKVKINKEKSYMTFPYDYFFPVLPNPPRVSPSNLSTTTKLISGCFIIILNWQILSYLLIIVSIVA